jgi:hypothetical protein
VPSALIYIIFLTGRQLGKEGSDVKLLTLELNPSAQRCLTRFFTGNFSS